jgi:hypothetical protein
MTVAAKYDNAAEYGALLGDGGRPDALREKDRSPPFPDFPKLPQLLTNRAKSEQSGIDDGDCLAHYPFVVVRIACRVCSRRGSYRLARLPQIRPEITLINCRSPGTSLTLAR